MIIATMGARIHNAAGFGWLDVFPFDVGEIIHRASETLRIGDLIQYGMDHHERLDQMFHADLAHWGDWKGDFSSIYTASRNVLMSKCLWYDCEPGDVIIPLVVADPSMGRYYDSLDYEMRNARDDWNAEVHVLDERGLSPYNYARCAPTPTGMRWPVSPLTVWFTAWCVAEGLVVGELKALVDTAVPLFVSYFR